MENKPTELKISMEGTSNWGQRKDTYQAIGFKTRNPDNTKETLEQQEKVANLTGPDNKMKQKALKPKPPIKTPQDQRDDLVTRLDDTPTKTMQPPANSQSRDSVTRGE